MTPSGIFIGQNGISIVSVRLIPGSAHLEYGSMELLFY